MQDFFTNLLLAVVTAVVPVISAFFVSYIKRARDKAVAGTENIKQQGYIREIMNAIADAVAATSQTYVDTLKQQGKFTPEAQREAASKALKTCMSLVSPAAIAFIEFEYGEAEEYLSARIEAEVRKQKFEQPAMIALPVRAEGIADTDVVDL